MGFLISLVNVRRRQAKSNGMISGGTLILHEFACEQDFVKVQAGEKSVALLCGQGVGFEPAF